MIIQLKLTPNAKGTQKLGPKRHFNYIRRRRQKLFQEDRKGEGKEFRERTVGARGDKDTTLG